MAECTGDAHSAPDQEWLYLSHGELVCDTDVVAPHELLIIKSCPLLTPDQVRLVQQHHHASKLLYSRVAGLVEGTMPSGI